MSQAYPRGPASLDFNMTPMIDIVFLIIIFFVLVAQFVSRENLEMELPGPADMADTTYKPAHKVTINATSGGGGRIGRVRAGSHDVRVDQLDTITEYLRGQLLKYPDLEVTIRADQRLHYGMLQRVLFACAAAEVTKMNIVALKQDQ